MWRNVVVLAMLSAVGAVSSPAQPVSPEFQVNPAQNHVWPIFSTNRSGDFVVAWNHDDEAFARIYSSADAVLGPEISIPITGTDRPPWDVTSIALGPDRSFVITQAGLHAQGLTSGISARIVDSTGSPRSPEINMGGIDAHGPHVVMDGEGGFVAWHGQTNWFGGPMETVFGDRFDASGTFLRSLFRIEHEVGAHVSMNASGRLVVSWGTRPFLARTISRDNIAGPTVEVVSDTGIRTSRSYIRDDGSFTSVWSIGDRLFGHHYTSSGAPIGASFEFESAPGFLVSTEGAGFIVVGSVQFDGTARNVVARRYDSMGVPRGPAFRVNVGVGGNNNVAAVGAIANGAFVVIWVRDGTIYGRIFDATTSVKEITWTDLRTIYRR